MTPKGLTDIQLRVLEFIANDPHFTNQFYLSGGTALSAFYLHHRFSEDLDFFAENEFDSTEITNYLLSCKKLLKFDKLEFQSSFNRNLYFLTFPNSNLKLEFTYYPFPRIEIGQKFEKLAIDSMLDIAVNKLFTIYQKPRGRDYFDLFEIIKNKSFQIPDLIRLARVKFDSPIDLLLLGKNFSISGTFFDDPILPNNFDKAAIENFFKKSSIDLSPSILE